jgi:5-methylcytosine-specific restriction endonuclease McrA
MPRGWPALRRRIIRRDPTCQACGRAPSTTVDHVTPRARGGSDHPDNLAGLCSDCHAVKTKGESAAARWSPEHRTRRPDERRPGIV